MAGDVQDRQRCEASRTAVESLLRTLDDAAEWENRTASRVRAFATTRNAPAAPDAHLARMRSADLGSTG